MTLWLILLGLYLAFGLFLSSVTLAGFKDIANAWEAFLLAVLFIITIPLWPLVLALGFILMRRE